MPPSVSRASTCPYARTPCYYLDVPQNLNSDPVRIAVWSQNKVLIVGLVLVIMGHWSLLLHGTALLIYESLYAAANPCLGILLKAKWVPGKGCMITNTNNTLLAATFIYSMCFDFTVLVLTAVKLVIPTRNSERSRLVTLIFGDGLIFFVIAFLSNLIATVWFKCARSIPSAE